MRYYEVKSLPIKDVIGDLAREFNVNIISECDKYTVHLPEHIGTGHISGISFGEGLGYLEYNCTFYYTTKISFVVNDVHPLKFIYCIKGSLTHSFEHQPERYNQLDKYQNIIVASSNNKGHLLTFTAQEPTSIISLEINRNVFLSNIECSINKEEIPMKSLFNDIRGENLFLYEGQYSLRIAELAEEIRSFKDKHLLEVLHLKSRAYEIFKEQIMLFRDDQQLAGNRTLLRKSEIEKIHQADEHIRAHLDASLTVDEIAANIGMSIPNVQAGFKAVFHKTVNAYVREQRLTKAKKLLIETDLSVSEIVYEIGLNNKSYFSKIFKEAFDITPSDFRSLHFN